MSEGKSQRALPKEFTRDALGHEWFGVSKAGYSIKDEAPVALLVFAVPAIVAIVIWWRFSAY